MKYPRHSDLDFESALLSPVLEIIKRFSCSTLLSMKFQELINVKVTRINEKFQVKIIVYLWQYPGILPAGTILSTLN